jgi:hypothetical protein
MKKIITISSAVLCHFALFAQPTFTAGDAKSAKIQPFFVTEANMQTDPLEYESFVEGHAVNHKSAQNSTDSIQIAKTKIKTDALGNAWGADIQKTRANEPIFINGFNANTTTSTPPDNTIAVNSVGQIVSIINSNVRVYNTSGTSLYLKSIYSFLNLGLVPGQDTFVSTICDPKVLFDCEKKRFIAFAMTCDAKADHSKIMVAFSKAEDPLLGWNVYTYKADVFLNDFVWFDHPRIGINGFDFFVSGNMFSNALAYQETNIYQIDKLAGYNGDANPASWAYHNLLDDPFTPSFASDALCGSTGNRSYFIATSGGNNNKLKFYTLTGRANAGVSPTIAYQSITVPSYSPPGYSPQPGTTTLLRTGDCRSHDAYYLNGNINFTFHTDAGGGYAGLYLARLKNTAGAWSASQTKVFKSTNVDLTYPSIAHYGTSGADQTTLITYLSSGVNTFGSMNAVVVDPNMNAGTPVLVKAGVNFMNYNPQTTGAFTTCRWGDYSGSCVQAGTSVPSVWFSGMFGNSSNNWTNYIARLNRFWATGVTDNLIANNDVKIYPNPALNKQWNMEVQVEKNTFATFELTNLNGSVSEKIYEGVLKQGKNNFNFSTIHLAPGLYLVKILSGNKLLQTQKLIIGQ